MVNVYASGAVVGRFCMLVRVFSDLECLMSIL